MFVLQGLQTYLVCPKDQNRNDQLFVKAKCHVTVRGEDLNHKKISLLGFTMF